MFGDFTYSICFTKKKVKEIYDMYVIEPLTEFVLREGKNCLGPSGHRTRSL